MNARNFKILQISIPRIFCIILQEEHQMAHRILFPSSTEKQLKSEFDLFIKPYFPNRNTTPPEKFIWNILELALIGVT